MGKNLFDGQLELGSLDASGINMVDSTRVRSINYIPIKPLTTYVINISSGSFTLEIRYYDINQVCIGSAEVNE